MGKRYKAKRRKVNVAKSIEGMKRKSTLSNIWINLGYRNPYGSKQTAIAGDIAAALLIEVSEAAIVDEVISWVKANRPDLLMTAKARHAARKTAAVQPEATTLDERQAFYRSWAWREKRAQAFKIHGRICQCCGATPGKFTVGGDPVILVVDHIKPLSKYWDLRLKLDNLQILCEECNMGKGNWDETDYRAAPLDPLQRN
jgi:5-methylcytosine-specific restriction endonuclease McrA